MCVYGLGALSFEGFLRVFIVFAGLESFVRLCPVSPPDLNTSSVAQTGFPGLHIPLFGKIAVKLTMVRTMTEHVGAIMTPTSLKAKARSPETLSP